MRTSENELNLTHLPEETKALVEELIQNWNSCKNLAEQYVQVIPSLRKIDSNFSRIRKQLRVSKEIFYKELLNRNPSYVRKLLLLEDWIRYYVDGQGIPLEDLPGIEVCLEIRKCRESFAKGNGVYGNFVKKALSEGWTKSQIKEMTAAFEHNICRGISKPKVSLPLPNCVAVLRRATEAIALFDPQTLDDGGLKALRIQGKTLSKSLEDLANILGLTQSWDSPQLKGCDPPDLVRSAKERFLARVRLPTKAEIEKVIQILEEDKCDDFPIPIDEEEFSCFSFIGARTKHWEWIARLGTQEVCWSGDEANVRIDLETPEGMRYRFRASPN